MTLTCNTCGREFEAQRSDAKYCSTNCRVAAHRKAHAPEHRRRPLPPQIRYAAFDLEKAVTRLERLAEDDRFKKAVNIHDVNSVKWTLERLEKVAQAFESVGVTE